MLALLLTLFACADKTVITDSAGGGADADGLPDGATDADGDGYLDTVDCDDADGEVNPGAAEVWYDGTDQDCDGADDDQDGDGVLLTDDCDDTDPAVYPQAGEIPDDGVDQDCDGADAQAGPEDADGDGYTASVDCDDGDAAVYPGAADLAGDGIDQDCNGSDDPPAPGADEDGDGWASEAFGGPDCDDGDADIRPDATEVAGDDLDVDCDGADYGVSGLVVGDLVVTEIMYDPDAVSDGDGEWFELYNATGHIVNLEGLVVADDAAYDAADIFTVTGDLLAAPGARLVFAVSADAAQNGGIAADYDYAGGGVSLNNGGDDLYVGVSSGGAVTTIDAVTYDEAAGWPLAKGMSIELYDTSVSASQNDASASWCRATATAGTTSDKGSPGAASSGC